MDYPNTPKLPAEGPRIADPEHTTVIPRQTEIAPQRPVPQPTLPQRP